MNVLLLGASGFTGKVVLSELLKQGHHVVAMTRNSASIKITHPNLHVVEGNVLDERFIQQALIGQEAVMHCLGIGGKGDGKPNALVSNATRILVEQMETSQVKRLICMSNVGAGDSELYQPWFFRKLILPYFMKWLKVIIDDKNIMEPIIMKSSLQWTIVRCPNIIDKPAKGKTTVSFDGKKLKLSITNSDLAAFMVQQLERSTLWHRCPSVSN